MPLRRTVDPFLRCVAGALRALAFVCALSWVCAPPAAAGVMTRATLAQLYPPPYRIGEPPQGRPV